MPRFYFHIQTAERLIKDGEGTDCSDVAEARRQAGADARDLLSSSIQQANEELGIEEIVVEDEQGHPVTIVRMTDVLPRNIRARLR
ncbi:MAG: DUF6894 family protein [Xanthobacteraceae bacterium]